MKYIILERIHAGVKQRIPIIFPNDLVHKHVAQAIKNLPGNPYNIQNKVYSAGDALIEFHGVTTSGRSDTLKINSKPGDNNIIEMHDILHGIDND